MIDSRQALYPEALVGLKPLILVLSLEDVVIGVCNNCGNRYYSAETLNQVKAIATGEKPPVHTETVPVAHAD